MFPFIYTWERLICIQNKFKLPFSTKNTPSTYDSETLGEIKALKDNFMFETSEEAESLKQFMLEYASVKELIFDFDYRYKEDYSLELKWSKQTLSRPLNKVINDALGIRFIMKMKTEELSEFAHEFVDYCPDKSINCKLVDYIKDTKATNDGYQGIHLYIKKDNYCFPIEIQFWTRTHALLNQYLHENIYKASNTEKYIDYAVDLRVWLDKVPQMNGDHEIFSYVDYLYERVFT